MAAREALSLRGGRAAPSAAAAHRELAPSQQREKGLWNFLTWSFFISQILAAEHFFGAGARAAEAAPEQPAQDAAAGRAESRPLAAETLAKAGVGQAAPEADAPLPLVLAQDIAPSLGLAGLAATPLGFEALSSADEASAFIAPQGGADGLTPAAQGQALAGDLLGIGGPGLGLDLGVPLAAVTDPLSDLLQGLGPVVEPILDGVVAPVLGVVAPVLDIVAPGVGVVAPVAGIVAPVVEAVVAPVAGIVAPAVEGVVAPVAGIVAPVVEGVVAPVAGIVAPVVEGVVAPVVDIVAPGVGVIAPVAGIVAPLVEGVVASVAGIVAPVVEGVAAPVAGIVAPVVEGVVASGGSIDVGQAAPAGLDDLFTGQGYSDYNLALRSSVASELQPAAASLPAAAEHLAAIDPLPVGDASEGGPSLSVAMPSVLDDIAHRSLGDGIGL